MIRFPLHQFNRTFGRLFVVTSCMMMLAACNTDHRDAVIHNNTGVSKLESGQLNKAHEAFNAAIEADPTFAPPYFYRGHIDSKQGRPDEAIANLQKTLELEPNQPEAHYELALVYLNISKHADAVTHFNKALEQDPSHGKSYYQLGLIAVKARSYEKANTAFRKAITTDPSQVSAFSELGQLYEHFGSIDEAIQVYRESIRLNLDDTTNRKLLANLLFNRHQEDNAIQLLLEARTIDPNDAELYFNLGVAYDRAWNRSKLLKDVSPAISKKYKRDAIQNFQNYLMLAKRADDGKSWPHLELAEIMVDNIRKGARIVY